VVIRFKYAAWPAPATAVNLAVKRIVAIAFALGVAIPGPCPAVLAQNDTLFNPWPVVPGRPERVLQFPKDYSLGEIMITSGAPGERAKGAVILRGAARGKVIVPAGKIVVLTATHRLLQDPKIIQTIDPAGLDSLKINATSLEESEDSLCDRTLKFVGHLKGLADLSLDRSDSTDLGVARAAELPNLNKLSVFGTQITGTCLQPISALKKLRILRLSHNNLKEENLKYLSALPGLECLSLCRTGLSATGMKYVAKCPKLTILDLSENPKIGDQSIKDILCLKKLAFLALNGTQISTRGILQLKPLPLKWITLPTARYKNDEMISIRKAFPGVTLEARRTAAVDKDTKDLYAPLP
jgi:hypothetical protein